MSKNITIEQLLQHIYIGNVKVVIYGLDLGEMLSIHTSPLPNGRETTTTEWYEAEHHRIDLRSVYYNRESLIKSIKAKWPQTEILYCGCTCCCDWLEPFEA